MTEFKFGDNVYVPGDFVKIQTVENNCCQGFIQSITTRMSENTTVTIIELITVNGGVLITADEIEFIEGEF